MLMRLPLLLLLRRQALRCTRLTLRPFISDFPRDPLDEQNCQDSNRQNSNLDPAFINPPASDSDLDCCTSRSSASARRISTITHTPSFTTTNTTATTTSTLFLPTPTAATACPR
jgi:hypothetical protein